MVRYVGLVIVGMVLAACTNPFEGYKPSEADVLKAGWFEPSPRAILAKRYCYRTLADVDCHAQPLTGEEGRQVGFFDAPLTD